MDNIWYQFSVYDPKDPTGKFPKDAYKFLSNWYFVIEKKITRWHFLFEPQLLVRFQVIDDYSPKAALFHASVMAEKLGLGCSKGDLKASSPSGQNGWEYYGEQEFYGSAELWEANADFLDATSRIALLSKIRDEDSRLIARKHTHLLANQFGMHYGQEAKFFEFCSKRSKQLYKKYGEQ